MSHNIQTVQFEVPTTILESAKRHLDKRGVGMEQALTKFLHHLALNRDVPDFLNSEMMRDDARSDIVNRIETVRNQLNDRDGKNTWRSENETRLNGMLSELCAQVRL